MKLIRVPIAESPTGDQNLLHPLDTAPLLEALDTESGDDDHPKLESTDQPSRLTQKLPKLLNGRWHYPILRITCSSISFDGAIQGGYGGLFGSYQSGNFYHIIDVSVTIPMLGQSFAGEEAVFGRSIVGGLTTTDSSGSISYAIAKATVSGVSNTLNVEAKGVADSAVPTLKKMSGQSLTTQSAQNFGTGIGEAMKWIVDHSSNADFQSRPNEIFRPMVNEADRVRSVCFALGQISTGATCEAAIKELKDYCAQTDTRPTYLGVDPVYVAAVYHLFLVVDVPKTNQIQLAKSYLQGAGVNLLVNQKPRPFKVSVLPYIRSDGAIASLGYLSPDSLRIQAQPWPPDPQNLSAAVIKIGEEELDLKGALDLGLGILGDMHVSDELRFCSRRCLSYYEGPGVNDTLILKEEYSAGIRASLRYNGAEVAGGSASVAAKVTLDSKAVSFSIDILGVDTECIPSIAGFVSGSTTSFSPQTLELIGGLWSEVNGIIAVHDSSNPSVSDVMKGAWKPCLSAVYLNLGAPEIQDVAKQAGSIAFAQRMIANRSKLSDALAKASTPECKQAVIDAYKDCAGDVPSREERDRAQGVLDIGI